MSHESSFKLFIADLRPDDARQMTVVSLCASPLSTVGTIAAAPAADHQIRSGRCRCHADVPETENGKGPDARAHRRHPALFSADERSLIEDTALLHLLTVVVRHLVANDSAESILFRKLHQLVPVACRLGMHAAQHEVSRRQRLSSVGKH
jgi:hypothetical protein